MIRLIALTISLGLLSGYVYASDSWQASPSGIGPIKIGMTEDELRRAVHERLTKDRPETHCYYMYSKDQPNLSDGRSSLSIMLWEGVVVRVEVTRPQVRFANGFGIGTKQNAIISYYDDMQVRTERNYISGHHDDPYKEIIVNEEWPSDGAKISNEREILFHKHNLLERVATPIEYGILFSSTKGLIEEYRVGLMDAIKLIEGCE